MAVAKRNRPLPAEVPPENGGAPAGKVTLPKFETPKPADPSLPVPRVIDAIERAPRGTDLRRFKVRCEYYSPKPIRYILARTSESAEEEYLRAVDLDLTKLPRGIDPPRLITTELED